MSECPVFWRIWKKLKIDDISVKILRAEVQMAEEKRQTKLAE
jgi:hypothetical protein